MRSLFVALGVYVGVGGLERFNQRVVRCLGELGLSDGLESAAIALWDSDPHRAGLPEPVRFLPGRRRKLPTALRFAWQVWRTQPGVILYGHILLSPLALLARLLSPRSRNLLVVHGWEVWREPFRTKIPLWERLAVRIGIDQVVSVSRLTAGRMEQAYGIDASRFRILANAVDLTGTPPARPPRDGKEPRLLTVTRLSAQDRYKGCDKVIRALPMILREVPSAHYDIVGDGALRPELERLAEETGVRAQVHFHGYISDATLEQVYETADVLIMPSTGEGFGIVYLEAWKHGLPVICGNRDASAEVVTDGVDGFCVDPDSVEGLAAASVSLLTDRQAAVSMGRRGYQKVFDLYSHEHFRRTLWQILQS